MAPRRTLTQRARRGEEEARLLSANVFASRNKQLPTTKVLLSGLVPGENFTLFVDKILDVVFGAQKNIRTHLERSPEAAFERLLMNRSDQSVMKVREIARECQKLLVRERGEVAFGCIQ